MDAQRIARPVLVAQSAAVAIQSKTGLALGGPLRRADVAFVSVASVHGVLAKPGLTRSSQSVSCQAPTYRVAPRCPCGHFPVLSRLAGPCRAGDCPAGLRRAKPHRATPVRALSPLRAYPCLAQPSHGGCGPVVPRSASSRRPCGRFPALSGRGWSCSATSRNAGASQVKPLVALTGVSLSRLVGPRPVRCSPNSPSLVTPELAQSCSPLQGASLPCLARPRPAPLRSRFATPGLAKFCPATIGPALFALTGASLSCPVKPRHVTPSRVRSCLVLPVRSTPCPDKQNPEHLRSRDLLKVHGGCTDVRDSTHERATKQPPSREPSAVPVYHSRVVPVNRG